MLDEEHLPKGKTCSTCKEWKPLDEFNKRSASKDGRQWNCRDCNKAYHYANFDRHMARIRARNRRMIEENTRLLAAYFAEHPCVDCGESDIAVLEFDHLRDKRGDIARLVRQWSWSALLVEIAKCDVVCANCHRRRTFTRQGCWRVVGFPDD
ncbi:MAG: hypothetical protein JO248_09480 [Acidimicrobiia bacterium]|nr:hypothetical protein [Acidimicrobiia bacterium]